MVSLSLSFIAPVRQMRWVALILAVGILACQAKENWGVKLSLAQAKQTASEMKADPMRIADRIDLGTVTRVEVWCWCGFATMSRHTRCEVVQYGVPITHLDRYVSLKVASSRTGESIRCPDHVAVRNTLDALIHSATRSFRESCRVMQQLVRDNYSSPFSHAVDAWLELRRWQCALRT